jgi:hypothetical protein
MSISYEIKILRAQEVGRISHSLSYLTVNLTLQCTVTTNEVLRTEVMAGWRKYHLHKDGPEAEVALPPLNLLPFGR